MIPLVCITCRKPLLESKTELLCPPCGKHWPVVNGVPAFVQDSSYWGEIPQPHMREVLAAAREKGWRRAVNESTFIRPTLRKYIDDAGRLNWRFLLPVTPRTKALDVGCGWGSLTLPLAKLCGEVTAFDAVAERAEFTALRVQQEGCANVRVIRARLLDAPLPDDAFDLVVMNGVLEWVAEHSQLPPRQAQLEHLRTVLRWLKPGGWLCVGIENRFSANLLWGARDHSGLPYTSLMPRWAANACCRLLRGKSYRTYTYSHAGYRRLLEESGYRSVRVHLSLPSYSKPGFLMPMESAAAFRHFFSHVFYPYAETEGEDPQQERKRLAKMQLMYWGARLTPGFKLKRFFAPFFTITAQKPN